MTLDRLTVEVAILQQQRKNQKQHWLRWGLAGNVAGAILFAAVAFKVAITGDAPPPAMIFIALKLSLVGIAFTTGGRLLALPRRRQPGDSAQ
jgi:hypothetical protein